MKNDGLFALREHFNGQNILICFNGPISRSLLEEIGNALKNHMQAAHTQSSAALDVFGVYIEMSQNIRHYAASRGYGDAESSATVVIAREDDGHYTVSAGNLVEQDDGRALLARIEALAGLDKAQLKAAYKEQLRKPRDPESSSGAGLGLLDMARKTSAPLQASLVSIDAGRAFFSLQATI
ncbi:MAG: biofilm regulation protein kinase SiaB [Candidatus Methylumidiphilus sp.]